MENNSESAALDRLAGDFHRNSRFTEKKEMRNRGKRQITPAEI